MVLASPIILPTPIPSSSAITKRATKFFFSASVGAPSQRAALRALFTILAFFTVVIYRSSPRPTNTTRTRTSDWSPKGKEADKYRRENCHSWPTKIKLLGVWDTVGALGAPYGEILGYLVDKVFKCSFHDLELSESVDSAYHAMAADERRWPFRPTPIELTAYHEERNRANRAEFGFSLYEQKWFPGVHSNVGGGYDRLGLSDCALEWMAECAKKNGLNVKALDQVQFAPGRAFDRNLTQPIEKSQKLYYQALTTLIVKLPSLIGLVLVYPGRDRPLAKHITSTGDYIRPIGPDEDVSMVKEKKSADPGYNPPNVH